LLIVLFSALLSALAGAGALLCRALLRSVRRRLFTSLAVGISCLHALVLTGLPMKVVLGALFAMAAAEGVLLWRERAPRRASAPAGSVARRFDWRIALVFAAALPLWAYLMVRPLWAFDPRNVWFFAGRIIHASGHFPFEAFHRLMCHWGPDYRLNMNADYPKLVGALTASVATLAGYWNEYLPKIAILILHTLALVGLVELGWRWRAVVLTLAITAVTRYRSFFASAMLDIHVALLTLIAFLCLARFVDERTGADAKGDGDGPTDRLGMAAAALAVASQLKYEGRALAMILLLSALVARSVRVRDVWRIKGVLLAFVPTVMWLVEVRLFQVPSYLQYSQHAPVIMARLRHDLFQVVLPAVLGEGLVRTGAVFFAISLVAAAVLAPRVSLLRWARDPRIAVCFVAAAVYTAAISLVYMVSPYPTVQEHMETSVNRATLPIEVALFAAALATFEMIRRARSASR
jgi:hypothetical protein